MAVMMRYFLLSCIYVGIPTFPSTAFFFSAKTEYFGSFGFFPKNQYHIYR